MRRPHFYSSGGAGFANAMTSMIDVVFLLLIFFLVTASFTPPEYSLPGDVSAVAGSSDSPPPEQPPEVLDFDPVIVRIHSAENGAVWEVNDLPAPTLADLAGILDRIRKRDAPLILDPDDNVQLGAVIDAYDVARAKRFAKIQFAASGPS